MAVQKNVFGEVANLCGRNRKMNLDYSITDVQWEPAGGKKIKNLICFFLNDTNDFLYYAFRNERIKICFQPVVYSILGPYSTSAVFGEMN
jgi:hypothetical protein